MKLKDIVKGSVVRAKDNRGEFVVTANYGDRVTLVRAIELTEEHVHSWRVVASEHKVLETPLDIEKNT